MKEYIGLLSIKKRINLLFIMMIILVINLFSTTSSLIEGIVYDKETGKPIEGARVCLINILYCNDFSVEEVVKLSR